MSKPKTITIRIAVAMDEDGNWAANGFGERGGSNTTDAMGMATECCPGESTCLQKYWITAQVAKATEITVPGAVEPAKKEADLPPNVAEAVTGTDGMVYHDMEGRECNLDEICRREPVWAASRLRVQAQEIAALRRERDEAISERESIKFAALCQPLIMQCHYPEHGLLGRTVATLREELRLAGIENNLRVQAEADRDRLAAIVAHIGALASVTREAGGAIDPVGVLGVIESDACPELLGQPHRWLECRNTPPHEEQVYWVCDACRAISFGVPWEPTMSDLPIVTAMRARFGEGQRLAEERLRMIAELTRQRDEMVDAFVHPVVEATRTIGDRDEPTGYCERCSLPIAHPVHRASEPMPPLRPGQCSAYRDLGYVCAQPEGHEGDHTNVGPFAALAADGPGQED